MHLHLCAALVYCVQREEGGGAAGAGCLSDRLPLQLECLAGEGLAFDMPCAAELLLHEVHDAVAWLFATAGAASGSMFASAVAKLQCVASGYRVRANWLPTHAPCPHRHYRRHAGMWRWRVR